MTQVTNSPELAATAATGSDAVSQSAQVVRAKPKPRNRKAFLDQLVYTDTALPFFGIDNGCISLKGGGAAILVQITGYDYESSDGYDLLALNSDLANALAAVSTISGLGANSGIRINLFTQMGQLDTSGLFHTFQNAESNIAEPGLAGQVLFDERYIAEKSQASPFPYHTPCIAISLGSQAIAQEKEASRQEEEVVRDWEEQMEALASENSAIGNILSDAYYLAGGNSSRSRGGQSLWQTFVEGARDMLGLGGNGLSSRLQLGGSISTHPIPKNLAQTLRQKVELILRALAKHGIHGKIPTSLETALLLAKLLYIPNRPAREFEYEINREAERLEAVNALVTETLASFKEGSARGSSSKGKRAYREQLDELELAVNLTLTKLDQQAALAAAAAKTNNPTPADNSLFKPRSSGSNSNLKDKEADNGQIDVSAFGGIPLEFTPLYVRVGVDPGVEQALIRLERAIGQFKRLPYRPQAAIRHLGQVLTDYGIKSSWPKASYLASMYAIDWPREVTNAQLRSLLVASGLELLVNTQIIPQSKKRVQKDLERRRQQLVIAAQIDRNRGRQQQTRQDYQAVDQLAGELAGEDGLLYMVGLRLTVRADSPPKLRQAVGRVKNILQGVGIRLAETAYNQAFGWYSSLPIGKDFLGDTPLWGKRTLRNMGGETAVCFFPALVPNRADEEGILIGTIPKSGGLVRLSDTELINPHEVICGMSGSGKTVSVLLEIIRRLYTNPKVRVRIIDPQNVTSRLVEELGGEVANVSAGGAVRFNFLFRYSLGGRPQFLSDLCSVITTMLIFMQGRSLADTEQTTLRTMLSLLYHHFEGGQPVTHYLLKGVYHRYAEQLGFLAGAEGAARYHQFSAALEGIYQRLTEQYRIPQTGFVVRPVLDPETHEYETRVYEYTDPVTNQVKHSEPGVVLEVLKTRPRSRFSRNIYSGGGSTLIEIPAREFAQLYQPLAAQDWGELELEGWLAYALTEYLAKPFPRRLSGTEGAATNYQWYTPSANPTTPSEAKTKSTTNPASQAEKVLAEMAGQFVLGSGPLWYGGEGWQKTMEEEFGQQLEAVGLFDRMARNDLVRKLVSRDLLVGLKRGEPILSDLIPLLASEPAGMLLAQNLEPYCNKNIYGSLFNGYTNLDVNSRIFSFNIKSVSKELLPLRMMQCIELTWREIASNPKIDGWEYILLWDEYGTIAVQSPEAATYIGLMFKRARAFGGKIIVAEQNYATFLTLAGQFAMANAGIIKLLRQDKRGAEFWGAELDLSQAEQLRLMTASKGEALIQQNLDGRVSRVVAQYDAHVQTFNIVSTKRADVEKYELAQRKLAQLTPVGELMRDILSVITD